MIFSLVGGLAIAIILQLLLASLGLALGLTILDLSPSKSNTDSDSTASAASSQSKFSLPTAGLLGNLLGFGIALGLSGVIFVTAFSKPLTSASSSTLARALSSALFFGRFIGYCSPGSAPLPSQALLIHS